MLKPHKHLLKVSSEVTTARRRAAPWAHSGSAHRPRKNEAENQSMYVMRCRLYPKSFLSGYRNTLGISMHQTAPYMGQLGASVESCRVLKLLLTITAPYSSGDDYAAKIPHVAIRYRDIIGCTSSNTGERSHEE